jgi:hypothetical protein
MVTYVYEQLTVSIFGAEVTSTTKMEAAGSSKLLVYSYKIIFFHSQKVIISESWKFPISSTFKTVQLCHAEDEQYNAYTEL